MGLFRSKSNEPGSSRLSEQRANILTKDTDFFVREAYNTLRTNVVFSLTGDTPSKIIAVTSGGPSEGKSISSVNLAISLAESDKKVILLDCDMRRPKINRLLNLNSRLGVSNAIIESDKLSDCILTYRDNLHVMLSGSIPPNPSELLGSAKMARLLGKLREVYDYIVIDTPPVNLVTDAIVLVPNVDGVLMVVRMEYSDRGSVRAAVEQLRYVHANIIGFMLNGIDQEHGGYSYAKYGYSQSVKAAETDRAEQKKK